MEYELARHWWVLALRGVLAILFGLVAFFWPYIALLAVVYTFAAYALVDGAFALGALLSGQGRAPWWGLLLEGIAGIAFGIITFVWPWAPEVNLVVLLYLVAGWLVATGVFEVIAAIRLRREIQGEWLLALSGILSVLLGFGFALSPPVGLLVMALWMSAYAIVTGALLLAAGFRLRGLARRYAPRREAVGVP